MVAPSPVINVLLSDLTTAVPLPEPGRDIIIDVPDDYLTDERLELAGVEGLAIQRLISLANNAEALTVRWHTAAAHRLLDSPSVYPLAAVALCLNNARHVHANNADFAKDSIERARTRILRHRIAADMFADRQALICLDYERPSLPEDLYELSSRRLRPETDFESLVDDLVYAQRSAGFKAERLSKLRLALAVILRELLENTDDHATTDFDGRVLKPNSIRGLLVKRILEIRRLPVHAAAKLPPAPIPCLEFTIFDSGIGYYNSYRRQLLRGQARGEPVVVGDKQAETLRSFSLGPDVPLETEYAIVLKCLERHSESAIPDSRPGHRGMGLYEVLRALKMMQGMFEVRTGRIHGYRSFLEGELRVQLEPETSASRPGMPKASLLDVDRKLLKHPAPRELVRGSVVRVVVPLT